MMKILFAFSAATALVVAAPAKADTIYELQASFAASGTIDGVAWNAANTLAGTFAIDPSGVLTSATICRNGIACTPSCAAGGGDYFCFSFPPLPLPSNTIDPIASGLALGDDAWGFAITFSPLAGSLSDYSVSGEMDLQGSACGANPLGACVLYSLPGGTATPVPSPATLPLLASGFACLSVLRKRRATLR
jgi:hypothetical protein